MNESEKWLMLEDSMCKSDRVSRLDWLNRIMPKVEHLTFPAGLISKYLFEETRYSFVYGQFLASIILGFAFIEMTLAAWFYMTGRNDLERATITKLLSEAMDANLLTEYEYKHIENIRKNRNPITHFRVPLSRDGIEYRALDENDYPYSVIQQDACDVLKTVMHLLERNAF